MIWQNKKAKQSEEIKFVKNTILSIVKNLKIDIDVIFDDVLNSGFLVNKDTGKCLLIIEEQSIKDKNTSLDYKIVFKLIDFFHECKHYLQYTQETIPEIEISIESNSCQSPEL